jgi:hypothetical protein
LTRENHDLAAAELHLTFSLEGMKPMTVHCMTSQEITYEEVAKGLQSKEISFVRLGCRCWPRNAADSPHSS